MGEVEEEEEIEEGVSSSEEVVSTEEVVSSEDEVGDGTGSYEAKVMVERDVPPWH